MLHKISFRNIIHYAVSCLLAFFRMICEPSCYPTWLTLENQFSGYVRTVKFLPCYSFGQFLLHYSQRASLSTQVTDIHVKFYTFVQFLLLLFLGFIHRARTLSHSCIALFPSSKSFEIGNKYACAVSLF